MRTQANLKNANDDMLNNIFYIFNISKNSVTYRHCLHVITMMWHLIDDSLIDQATLDMYTS